MRKIGFCVITLFVFCTINSSAQKIQYQVDSAADFSKYKTYKWADIKVLDPSLQNLETRLTRALDLELTGKGLTKSNTDTFDVLIGYQASSDKEEIEYTTIYGGRVLTIHTGQIALDIYDSATHELVWRGTASKKISLKAKPEKQEANIVKCVHKLLENYPPKKES